MSNQCGIPEGIPEIPIRYKIHEHIQDVTHKNIIGQFISSKGYLYCKKLSRSVYFLKIYVTDFK